MKVKSRLLASALAGIMMLGLLSGCTKPAGQTTTQTPTATPTEQAQNGPAYLNETGFPIVKEPITLKAMVSQNAVQPPWEEILAWQEYEKMTGIKIEWNCIPSSSITEKRNLALASNDLPDMFYRASMPDKDIIKYGQQGTFIKLNDLINKYAPNLKKVMERLEDVRKGLPMPDGSIYAFPGLSDSLPVEINPKLYINQKWVTQVGGKMPTTTDELYDLLKAFKEKDGNGNGKADDIPWATGGIGYLLNSLKGAWGIGNKGRSNENFDIDPKTGKMRFIPASPEYKEMLEYVNKLYTEGLIDQEIFTLNNSKILAKNEQNLLGAFSYTNTAALTNTNAADFAGLEVALKGPHGDQIWAGIRSHFASKGSFVITNVNKYPEATVRWIDYFYGDEGARLIYMGVEGKSYKKNSDGSYDFLDEIVKNIPEGSSFDKEVSAYTPYAGGGLPALNQEAYFKGGETQPAALKAAENMKPYLPKEVWGPFTFSVEENDKRATFENDINSYITQMTAKFVQGKEPLSNFDAYVEQLKKMGLEEYMKLMETAYERYKKN